jgi:hypothetical protein
MSVSTRTAQQPLGLGQLGTTLVVIALALVVAAAVAFGSLAANKAEVAPAAGVGAPPAVIDHGSRGEMAAPINRDMTQNWGSYVIGGSPVGRGNDVVGNDGRHHPVPGLRPQ